MVDLNLATSYSNVLSKKTKIQNDLGKHIQFYVFFAQHWNFSWKPFQLAVFYLCFNWVNLFNFMFSLPNIVLWCVDYKSMPLVWILKFGNQLIHACLCSKKITEKTRVFQNQRKTESTHLFNLFSNPSACVKMC